MEAANKEKVNQWIDEYVEQAKKDNEKMQEIISDLSYIKWLEKFTLYTCFKFTDDDWKYSPEKISEADRERVSQLHLLYRGVDKFANKNYMYPMPCDFGNYYQIGLDGVGYQVGILVGQGTTFFCKRVVIDNPDNFIDFIDIVDNKKSIKAMMIEDKLQDLSNQVVALKESGIPLEAIRASLENTINELRLPEEGKQKVKA